MDELAVADISQQYRHNVVLYKDRIVFVEAVNSRTDIFIRDLLTQEFATVPFSLDTFKATKYRLGMVNESGSVVYAVRQPVRRMGIGINYENLVAYSLGVTYPVGAANTVELVKSLTTVSLANTMLGIYPSLKDALATLKKAKKGAVAFDHQFAVSSEGFIWYKLDRVGMCSPDASAVDEIVFAPKKSYLSILLDGNHAKTIRYSSSQ